MGVSSPAPQPTASLVHEARLWRRGVAQVVGIDEVGVGPLAGPVVAAAVILPAWHDIPGVDDSKRLSPARREAAAQRVRAAAVGWSLGICSAAEVDAQGIFAASRAAKRRALSRLLARHPQAGHALVDGPPVPDLGLPQTAIVGGDRQSLAIAAASVIAKVARDRYMVRQDLHHPGYDFARHKGYGTAVHIAALARLGPSPIHRRTFRVGARRG